MAGFSMGDPLHLRQVRGVPEIMRQCALAPHGGAKKPSRPSVIPPLWRNDRGPPATKSSHTWM